MDEELFKMVEGLPKMKKMMPNSKLDFYEKIRNEEFFYN